MNGVTGESVQSARAFTMRANGITKWGTAPVSARESGVVMFLCRGNNCGLRAVTRSEVQTSLHSSGIRLSKREVSRCRIR